MSSRWAPRLEIAVIVVCALVLAGCSTGRESVPISAEASAPGAVHRQGQVPPAGGVPPGFAATPTWQVDFAGNPTSVGDGFVGLVDTSSQTGHVVIQVVNQDGTLRFGVAAPPICSAFVVTRDGPQRLLVTMSTTLATATAASGTAHYYATARNLTTGAVVWGPTEVSGPWRGPGLIYGQHPVSQVGAVDSGAPMNVVDPRDGSSALTTSGAQRLVFEHDGDVVLADPGSSVSVTETTSGHRLWDSSTVDRPAGAAPGPATVTAAAGTVVTLAWTAADGTVLTGAYNLTTGSLLADLGTTAVASAVADTTTRSTVLVGRAPGADLVVIDPAHGTARHVSSSALHGAAPSVATNGLLYARTASTTMAIALSDGHTVAHGGWQPPTATSDNGTALVLPTDVARTYNALTPG